MDKFKGFEKAPLFILSFYIVEFGYSGQILLSGRVPLYRGMTVYRHYYSNYQCLVDNVHQTILRHYHHKVQFVCSESQ